MIEIVLCGCSERRDKRGWHRYRKTELCAEAIDDRREKDRRKYARRVKRETGRTVDRRDHLHGWVPGTPILVPEIDPL